jgi:tetratricopeptide (TPR) repeat protein
LRLLDAGEGLFHVFCLKKMLTSDDMATYMIRSLKKAIRVKRSYPFAFTVAFAFIVLISTPALSDILDSVPEVAGDAITPPDPIFDEVASQGIHLVFNGHFRECMEIFNGLLPKYTDHPAPYFLKAAAYQVWMGNYRLNLFQTELEKNIEAAIDKGKKLLERGPDPWVNFYVGAAYGYQAFNDFRKQQWITAYFDSKKGLNHLEETFILNPKIYDVYLAFGSYHYWRTAKSDFIRIVAFWIPDQRELGLRQLQFSIDHGRYCPNEASYGLINALFDYGEYEKAYEVLNRTIAKKAELGFSDLYLKGRLLLKFKKWQEAESDFLELLRRLESSEYPCIGYQVECKYWIAVALRAQNKISEAQAISQQALHQSEKRNSDIELNGVFEDFDEIHDQLKTLNDELQ